MTLKTTLKSRFVSFLGCVFVVLFVLDVFAFFSFFFLGGGGVCLFLYLLYFISFLFFFYGWGAFWSEDKHANIYFLHDSFWICRLAEIEN